MLKTFSAEELDSFEVWLKSPWFNTNRTLIPLISKSLKYHPDFDQPNLTKEKLFGKIQPKGKYSDRRMNNILSEGYLAAEQFLVYNNFAKDKILHQERLSIEFQSRSLDNWFYKSAIKALGSVNKNERPNLEEQFFLYQMNRRVYQHPIEATRYLGESNYVEEMKNHLDTIFLVEKAYLISDAIIRNRILRNNPIDNSKELENWKAMAEGNSHPSIELYRRRFSYTRKNMTHAFKECLEYFYEKCNHLNHKERKIHYHLFLNDFSFLAKSKRLDLKEMLPHYKFGLETGLLIHEGILTHVTFSGIIAVSNSVGDFEFSNLVINKYSSNLSESFRTDALGWAKIHTSYYQKKLLFCLDLFSKYEFKSAHFRVMGRILNMQIYFDLALIDKTYQSLLFNYFDSFEKWTARLSGQSKYKKLAIANLIRASRTLMKKFISPNFIKSEMNDILNKYESMQAANWVKARVEKIIALRQ